MLRREASFQWFVADAIFVGADSDVVIRAVFADVILERFDFEVNGAPADLRGRQQASIERQPVIKITVRVGNRGSC